MLVGAVGATGLAATTLSAATAAAITSTAVTASISLVQNGFQLDETFKTLISSNNLENLAFNMALSGLTAGISESIGANAELASNANIYDRTIYNSKNALTSAASQNILEAVVYGKSPEFDLGDLLTDVAINTASATAANEIGLAYKGGEIGKTTQLAFHAGLGCASGAAIGGSDGCGVGAVGAVVGEVVAETVYNNLDTSTAAKAEIAKNIAINTAEISSAVAGLLVDGYNSGNAESVLIGARTGRNAAKENAVYAATRDLATKKDNGEITEGILIGTHQFSILAPDNPEDFSDTVIKQLGVPQMQDLGDGTKGWVIGAHNRGNLKAIFNEQGDFKATQEFFNPKRYVKWYQKDLDTEAHKVKHKGLTDTQYITNILQNTVHYKNNETKTPLPYPIGGLGTNSNSWNQSILKYSGGIKFPQDFKGMDLGNSKLINKEFFLKNDK